MPRKRHQLVVSLGENEKGKALRDLFEGAAKTAGLAVSVWARKVLMQASSSSGLCVCGAPRDAADPLLSGIYQLYCCRSCGTTYSKAKVKCD